MTLIVALMAPTQAILVSDRRFTCNGRLIDDEKNKAASLLCADGRVAVAFTGLAVSGRFETARALVQLLGEAGKKDHLLVPTIQRFALAVGEEIRALNIPAEHKHLRFIFAGYRYNQGRAMPLLVHVSNAFNKDGLAQRNTSEKFFLSTWRNSAPFGSFGFGTTAGVSANDRSKLNEMLVEQRPAEALVNKTVELICNAADSPKSRNAVGKQCMSIVVPEEGGMTADFQSAKVQNKMYLPSAIISTPTASFTVQGGSISQEDPESGPLVVPRVGRNRPCPCGSGNKYKHCHGGKRARLTRHGR